MNRNIAGTPNMVVTLCAAMSASVAAGIEATVQDDKRALLERGKRRHVEAADMEDGRCRQCHVVRQTVDRMHAVDVVPPEISMGQHRPLRPAGGARCVHDQGDVILVGEDVFGGARRPRRPMRFVLGGEDGLQRRQTGEAAARLWA